MNKALTLLFVLMPTSVLADATKPSTSPLNSDYMINLLLSLGLIVGLIFVLAWLVKRFNFIPQQNQGLIKIISTLSVSSRDRLALIQVGEEQLLISLSPGKISKLHSLKTPVDISDQTQESFKNKFNSLVNKPVETQEDAKD